MFKQRLERLRWLSTEKNISTITAMAYFFENVAASATLLQHEKFIGVLNPFYSLALPVAQYYGEQVAITSMLIFCLKTHHFLYGVAEFSNQLFAMLYFFEDVNVGVASVSPIAAPMEFFRLDCLENKCRIIPRE